MLQKFEVQGVHVEIDDSLRKYINKKIGGLDRYISKHSRISANGEVFLKEGKSKTGSPRRICEVTIFLPHETIVVKENAANMYAAVDIAEAKLKQQLQKYKDRHGSGKTQRHLFARMRRKSAI